MLRERELLSCLADAGISEGGLPCTTRDAGELSGSSLVYLYATHVWVA